MATRTHALTHSSVFARATANARPSASLLTATLQQELLHGVAAQDAFVALFDEFPEFEELAREAAQAPLGRDPEPAARRERQASRRGGAARRTPSPGQKARRASSADSKQRA